MPQPFLPTFQDKRYSVGFEALKERPKFATIIGQCVALWSYVDNEVGGLFGILFGTESDAAYSVFLTLRRWSNQRKTLDAAAQAKLSGDELATYEALIVEYGSLESQRNDLGHGCFGNCPDDEDLLFMIKLEQHITYQADVLPRFGTPRYRPNLHQGLKENLYVYRMADLERLHSQMEQLWWDLFYFNGYLRDPKTPGRVAEFRKLFDAPRTQQRIAALREKKSQNAP
jgi:hypothetical protein